MTGPITRRRDIESLKTAARWPGADRNTAVILATRLAGVRADAEGYRYFAELAGARPGEALPLALAGFFQARLGEDAGAAVAKLDQPAEVLRRPEIGCRGLVQLGRAASTSSPSRAWKNPASASGSASPGRAPASSAK